MMRQYGKPIERVLSPGIQVGDLIPCLLCVQQACSPASASPNFVGPSGARSCQLYASLSLCPQFFAESTLPV